MGGDAIVGGGGAWALAQSKGPGRRRARVGTQSILPGAADRVDVPAPSAAPWRGVALLNMFRGGNLVLVGTGFLCEPDVVLTARHNLTSVLYDAAGVWLGYDAKSNPSVAPVGIASYAYHKDLDIAVLVLAAEHHGVFRLGGELPPAHAEVTLAGYSMPHPDGSPRFSYAAGAVRSEAGTAISYAISTREGDSGAPVFTVEGGVQRALAVHAEAAAGAQDGNSGVRITPGVERDIASLIAWARTQSGGSA